MDDQILLNSQDIHNNQVAVHNLQGGVGGAIIGTKHSVTEIYAIPSAKINDIWIDASTNHGWRSDGQGAGASHWTDVGVMRVKGDKGDKGNTGATGVGLEITAIYDTVVAMKAANPNPSIDPIEMHFVKENGGEFWAYEDTVPPHDGSHAAWHKVADHIQGPKGDKGDPGTPGKNGADGHNGASVTVATQAEVNSGTNATKAVTPKTLKGAYLPLTGGTLTGQLQVKKGTHIGHITTSSSGVFSMNGGGGWIGINPDGSVALHPATGKKVTYNGVEVATVSNVGYLPLTGGTLTGNLTIKKGTHEGVFSVSTSGVVGINTAGGWIGVNPDGSIALTPKAGEKVAVRGREVITGTYNSATKTLTLDV